MSALHVRTIVEALERPSTLSALRRKTGYPTGRLLQYMTEARGEGIPIVAVARGLNMTREPTYFYIDEELDGNTDS